MHHHRYIRKTVCSLALCALAVAGCGGTAQTNTPTAAPVPAAPPTAEVATQPSASVPTASSATTVAAAPTPAPTITLGPTAEAFPLQAGWWDSSVCYEVFVRSFYDSNGDGIGDINGLIQKLDYINDGNPQSTTSLGATCMWLMPVMDSPSYHGYDTIDYYKIEPDYGTNDDFKRLVEEAHKRGIKIILDLVLNHSSDQSPWFQSAASDPNSPYRDWYIWSKTDPGYPSPWGSEAWHKSPASDEYYYGIFSGSQPDLNYRNPAVTEEAHKISAFWINDMGADGFRLDAIKHLIENGQVQENTPETHAWLRDYRTFLEQSKPGTYTIGEIFDADEATLAPYYPDQLDEYFAFDVGERILNATNLGATNALMGAVERAYTGLPFQRWAPFLTNHDQNRAMSTLGNDPSKAKIAATALLTMPGLPFLYYGEEVGMLGAKPDEQIRNPMQWAADETTGGFTTGAPWEALQPNYKETNVAAQTDDPNSLLNLYRKLVHLHTQNSALAEGSFTRIATSNKAVAAFLRQSDDQTVLVVLNFAPAESSGITMSVDSSALAAGSYAATALLGDQPGAALTVTENGAFADYAPLATLQGRTGYIFTLSK